MSKAFTKEDVDPPERSGRTRSASGLPPRAVNYITRHGAQRLRAHIEQLRAMERDQQIVAEAEARLASATVVDPPEVESESVAFGAAVTIETQSGETHIYKIVGVDEVEFDPAAITWISPIGKILLAAELGDRVTLPGTGSVRITKIEYPHD